MIISKILSHYNNTINLEIIKGDLNDLIDDNFRNVQSEYGDEPIDKQISMTQDLVTNHFKYTVTNNTNPKKYIQDILTYVCTRISTTHLTESEHLSLRDNKVFGYPLPIIVPTDEYMYKIYNNSGQAWVDLLSSISSLSKDDGLLSKEFPTIETYSTFTDIRSRAKNIQLYDDTVINNEFRQGVDSKHMAWFSYVTSDKQFVVQMYHKSSTHIEVMVAALHVTKNGQSRLWFDPTNKIEMDVINRLQSIGFSYTTANRFNRHILFETIDDQKLFGCYAMGPETDIAGLITRNATIDHDKIIPNSQILCTNCQTMMPYDNSLDSMICEHCHKSLNPIPGTDAKNTSKLKMIILNGSSAYINEDQIRQYGVETTTITNATLEISNLSYLKDVMAMIDRCDIVLVVGEVSLVGKLNFLSYCLYFSLHKHKLTYQYSNELTNILHSSMYHSLNLDGLYLGKRYNSCMVFSIAEIVENDYFLKNIILAD